MDVTLACSEGTSIRAHKVVLSACSSYFQSLFLDHPARHPIVILKDVRFSELRTLIEFMYKGEVNVEYCQLSALLKTAESLKVKGLAEMTNQNTALKEQDRDSDRVRLHTPTTPSASAPSSSVKNEILELSNKQQRLENENFSPSPPSRVPSSPGTSLYQKKLTNSSSASATTTSVTGSSSHHIDSIIKEEPSFNDHRTHHQRNESMEDDDEDDENVRMKDEVGLNMTLNSTLLQNSISSSNMMSTSVNSTTSLSDIQSSRYTSGLLGNSSSGTRHSPLTSDMPGPSGIGPVQHAPLSLKKESDWDRSDDKESTSDYRHSHEMESSTDVHGGERASSSGVVVKLPLSSSSSSEQNSVSNNSGPIYPCMYCGQTFPHQSKLTRHILSHSLETLKHREVSYLLGHPQLAGFLPHDLPPPSHFTSRQASIDSSMEPHENSPMELENPFNNPGTSNSSGDPSNAGGVVLCKFCGKSFPDVSSLITHLPVHTGDRPFKCEFCGKAFKLRHHMKDHCRVHTGERPFRCNMCGKTFSRSTILKAHEKTHYPKYVRKFLSPSPVDSKDDAQQ